MMYTILNFQTTYLVWAVSLLQDLRKLSTQHLIRIASQSQATLPTPPAAHF